ncbi:tetratricopeptide repeat protein [Pyrinomonas methylaliphatogenes]|uniref:Tetratricopeptide repeat protein n=1 Tax=Pyrinomonas methylaliphatogenes TaxID=454194 RepID=A0A0B6WTP7_9BACT|nr:tetratricopeptide repeat protein [Pyrinomonas methylaliphatogenes]MBX5479229.1 tetratricopeptide repeat protein [Pyrinomonas methylaliphatogenes]CDM64067.1 tetratricopeptide repeat protein [Pyrinomonas methylaliphatogenes]
MPNWLQTFWSLLRAPVRTMRDLREESALIEGALGAFVAQTIFTLYLQWPYINRSLNRPSVWFELSAEGVSSLLFAAIVFFPILIFVANLFDRHRGFGAMLQQEYGVVATALFYAWAVAHVVALLLAVLARASGYEAAVIAQTLALADEWRQTHPDLTLPADPRLAVESFGRVIFTPPFLLWAHIAVRESFRLSPWRATMVLAISGFIALIIWPVLFPFLALLAASPFLLLFIVLLLSGWIRGIVQRERARTAFRRGLEAATLNPADASAHYNLGLLHLQRGELEEARRRFERAIEIDPDEIDAHYQLGRIARKQNRLAEAVAHFEQVVARDPEHAQYEVWREAGATYLAAGQFADAREMLAHFLQHRENDPEGLYLMGRTLFGLGRKREAEECMRACIEAVKSAPAYKYRTEKRWMVEAQHFLRSQS